MEYTEFTTFGLPHCIVMILVVLASIWMVKFFRSDASELLKTKVRYTFGGLLVFAVFMDIPLPLIRHGMNADSWALVWDSSLPLYLCDVVSLLLAYALFTKNQRIAEIGYLWGLAGTVQGLITPTLYFGWDTLDFYNFFLQHGGVPVAAITLVWGMGILPEKGAFKRAMLWSWGYMLTVICINFLIGKNYGFLNGKPEVEGTLFDYMGPEPWYLLTLQGVAFLFYYILLKIAPKAKDQHSTSHLR